MFHFFRLWRLSLATMCALPRVESEKRAMWVRVVDVYDGDTITVCHIADGKPRRRRVRLAGFDSPEMRTACPDEKEKAVAAREFLRSKLPRRPFKAQCLGLDKYGRLLMTFQLQGKSVADVMIENGHAYRYDGGKKEKK